MSDLTHLDRQGAARMVDVGDKPATARQAHAGCVVRMLPATAARITDGDAPKGDVLAAARIAGIQAAKRTWELIPLCHAIPLSAAHVDFAVDAPRGTVTITATTRTTAQTGVEMEALTAASVAALTLYDMLKSLDRAITITDLRLLEKTGGKSGTYRAAP